LATLVAVGWFLPEWTSAQTSEIRAAGSVEHNIVAEHAFQFFSFMSDPKFNAVERVALWSILGVAGAGLLYALMLVGQILREPTGTPEMVEIANAIKLGANAYLRRQFSAIVILIVLITILLYFTVYFQIDPLTQSPERIDQLKMVAIGRATAFLVGSIFSAAVGAVGMNLAVRGNVRVAEASKRSFGKALQIAYRTGTITGMLTDGLGLLGGTLIFMAYGEKAYEVLLGFGFGGTLLALFMRVGGGIYTKAADVGADLVGKIEKNVPEDDPRNAATIADNVGDNVGDCAGMAADIFESYEVTIVAAMILGYASYGHKGVIFPLIVRAIGVLSSIIGTYCVRTSDQARNAMKAINIGFITSAIISIVGFVAVGFGYLRFDNVTTVGGKVIDGLDMRPVWATLVGIVLAVIINRITEYFTHDKQKPVQDLARTCQTGHATNIIAGLALGYESTVWAILVIAASIMVSVLVFSGYPAVYVAYGVAMAGIGMLTLTGNNISMDVFGPVVDNANGIGEMAHLPKESRQTLSDLDAVGNTTKAITKGIAIASAVVAAVSLFNSYITTIASGGLGEAAVVSESIKDVIGGLMTLADPYLFIGVLIGGSVPFLFSSMTIRAVGRAAFLIVKECRVQFQDKAIWEGRKKPDYGRVVDICTGTAQKELIGPGLLAIFAPVLVGFLFGTMALAGFLVGIILVGQLLAVFMANAGGAWDNAKKYIEDGHYGGKGSEPHKAAVTGDTVGDPLKDTAGPSLNPMIKVMNMVSLLVLPLIMPYDKALVAELNKLGVPIRLVEKNTFFWGAIIVAVLAVVWAVWQSKRETEEMKQMESAVAETETSTTSAE
jgi:K(+)-stimulated pyrophosphate-energized sodium pump